MVVSLERPPSFEQMPTTLYEIGIGLNRLFEIVNQPTQNQEVEPPIDLKETALFTKLDEQTIYRLLRDKNSNFPGYKKNGKWYFFKSELVAYLKSGKCKSMQDLELEAEAGTLEANKRKGATV